MDTRLLDRAALSWGPMPAAFMADADPLNDKCKCGHPRREHAQTTKYTGCQMGGCGCFRFSLVEAAPDGNEKA
jgi:hypothetical protein